MVMMMTAVTVASLIIGVMAMAMATVGAAFRLKRFLHQLGVSTKTSDHVRQHMIMADQYPVALEFRRRMAITQVPCEPHQGVLVGRGDGQ